MADERDDAVKVVDRRWWARREPVAGTAAPEPARDGAEPPPAAAALEQQLADTSARLQGVLLEHRRARQEFEDVRARMRRDLARDVERGRRVLLAEFLDVLDNLDRALAAGRATTSAASGADADTCASLVRGVALVRDQFLAKLEQFGVRRLETLGEPFDAVRHEAVSTAPVTDPARDATIVSVVKEAYVIGDELLRPASVIVGRIETEALHG